MGFRTYHPADFLDIAGPYRHIIFVSNIYAFGKLT